MKECRVLIFSIALILIISGCSGEMISAEKGENIFGSFTAADIDGNPVDEQIFSSHKLTMINIWATFCNPCIKEMPDLGQLQSEFGEDFQIIGIVMDAADKNGNVLPDKKVKADSIIDSTGADYLHLLPSMSLNNNYLKGVKSVPETIFVDEKGNQIGPVYIGAKSKSDWQKIIVDLLKNA